MSSDLLRKSRKLLLKSGVGRRLLKLSGQGICRMRCAHSQVSSTLFPGNTLLARISRKPSEVAMVLADIRTNETGEAELAESIALCFTQGEDVISLFRVRNRDVLSADHAIALMGECLGNGQLEREGKAPSRATIVLPWRALRAGAKKVKYHPESNRVFSPARDAHVDLEPYSGKSLVQAFLSAIRNDEANVFFIDRPESFRAVASVAYAECHRRYGDLDEAVLCGLWEKCDLTAEEQLNRLRAAAHFKEYRSQNPTKVKY